MDIHNGQLSLQKKIKLYFQKQMESWQIKVDVVLPAAVLEFCGKDSFWRNRRTEEQRKMSSLHPPG